MKNEQKSKNKIYQKLESNKLILYQKSNYNNIKEEFTLNENEKECFSIILNILQKNNLSSTIRRVAGGWVRDKLLNKESDDIDIALSDIKGSKISSLINEELYPGEDKVGIIQPNGQKGKHLETATIKIHNIWIDFVNLRSEEENIIGTPLTDAQRRDLTINSLFYNINEKKVEDWTNKGLSDLKNGIIDTPIDAQITFRDDPLRILRMLRFALKYNFTISDNINDCIEKNIEEYRNNFMNNISPERIQKELFKILDMNNSSFAISYLYEFNLLDTVLQPSKYDTNNIYNLENLFLSVANLYILGEHIFQKMKIFDIDINKDNFNKINYGLFLLTLYFRDMKVKFRKENTTINKLIIRETLKASNEYIKENQILNENFDDLISLVNSDNYERLSTGKILRKIQYQNIIEILLAGICYEYIKVANLKSLISNIDNNILQPIVNKYKNFFNYITKENMLHINELKPLFNGKEITNLLNIKPGKEIGKLLELLIEEQIKNPELKKEIATEFLNKKRKEICLNQNENENNNKKTFKKKKKK